MKRHPTNWESYMGLRGDEEPEDPYPLRGKGLIGPLLIWGGVLLFFALIIKQAWL